MTDPQGFPVSGVQHERAVESIDPRGEKFGLSPLALGQIIDAYLASLKAQGVVLVDLSAVDDDRLAEIAKLVADAIERRFGGNERSDP